MPPKRQKDEARRAAEERRKELERIVKSRPSVVLPGRTTLKPYSKDYIDFIREIRAKPFSTYERAAYIMKKILPLKLPPDWAGIDSAAKTGYLAVDSSGVLALTLLAAIVMFGLTVAAAFLALGGTLVMFMSVVAAVGVWLVWSHPKANARAATMRMSADSVLAILYMVIYMRTSPNLEGALRFASETLTGPLSWDMKKLLWDIQLGVYPGADAALAGYAGRWRKENEEFAEALNILRGSAVEPSKRGKLFDEIVSLILRGTAERTKHYVSGLRMPVMLIHALGVLLPVMGLVLFPIIVIFMADTVSPLSLFLGYDVLLPLFLLLLIDNILKARPPTFSQPDISLAKDVPPLGKFRLGEMLIPIWPLALAVALPITLLALQGVGGCLIPTDVDAAKACMPQSFDYVNLSILAVAGPALGIVIYGFLDSFQKMKIRNDIEKIEGEFGIALFQLGSAISGGVQIELANEKAAANLKGMTIADLFGRTSLNMKKFGHTFEQALFDDNIGAVWWYPSRLVRSIMRTVLEASRKSLAAASDAMVTISNYLRGVHAVKEEVGEVLGETLSSMKFLAMLLTPLVAGVTITMAVVIIRILVELGSQIGPLLTSSSETPISTGIITLGFLKAGGIAITSAMFQLIVGIYMLEIAVILAMFLNRIEYGEDAVGLRAELAKTVLIAMVIYAISWLMTYAIFGNAIQSILTPISSITPGAGGG